MNVWDYYKLLGIGQGASESEIKKAYRRMAMEYHPDRNRSAGAHDMFVKITEAYEYLSSHPQSRGVTPEEYRRYYQAWVDYRQAEARKKAEEYAKASYNAFKKSPLYKSTTVIDGGMVFMGLGLALAVILMTVFGYSYRMKMATSPREEPSWSLALISLIIGILYLVISLIYLSAWIAQQKKKKDGKKSQNKKSV